MEIKEINKAGKRYGIVVKCRQFPEGLNFYTKDSDFVQVATWHYNKGKYLKAHSHKKLERKTDAAQEVVFVKKGLLKFWIYDDKEERFFEDTLKQGEILITFYGGHAYEILEDNTEILEVKNGPYPGLEKDKKVIEK